ncbi:MAG: hypothetical protein ACJA01_000694 [Saprospiraceae bacterium]|jgi:hypothetical protein
MDNFSPEQNKVKPILFQFEDDGLMPNYPLPVIIYRNVAHNIHQLYSEYLERVSQSNS